MKCCFDKGEKCSALRQKDCGNCRFRKTEEEFDNAGKHTESSLFSRSLGVRKIIKNGRKTVTVIPVIRV